MVKTPVSPESDSSVFKGSAVTKHKKPDTKKPGRPREIHYPLEKKFTLMLPKKVHKALKIRSAELETPMTTMIIDAIKKAYNI